MIGEAPAAMAHDPGGRRPRQSDASSYRDRGLAVCDSRDVRRHKPSCRSGTRYCGEPHSGRVTTSAAARTRRVDRGRQRGTNPCQYRCGSWQCGGFVGQGGTLFDTCPSRLHSGRSTAGSPLPELRSQARVAFAEFALTLLAATTRRSWRFWLTALSESWNECRDSRVGPMEFRHGLPSAEGVEKDPPGVSLKLSPPR
jgi:hypothetical protein